MAVRFHPHLFLYSHVQMRMSIQCTDFYRRDISALKYIYHGPTKRYLNIILCMLIKRNNGHVRSKGVSYVCKTDHDHVVIEKKTKNSQYGL